MLGPRRCAIRYILAILLVAAGGVALAAYQATPHIGPTILCGPIVFMGRTTTIDASCQTLTLLELGAALLLFFLGIVTALSARPFR